MLFSFPLSKERWTRMKGEEERQSYIILGKGKLEACAKERINQIRVSKRTCRRTPTALLI